MKQDTILVIEDDPDITELLKYNLEKEGFRVYGAADGEEGLKEAVFRKPSLILLDIMLPGMDGIEVCRHLKEEKETRSIPIVMLTAKGEESDIVIGLGIGADDYVAKPFQIKELVARVRAVLRRGPLKDDARKLDYLERGPLRIDPVRFEVFLDEKPVQLTLTEFRLCHALASHPGRVYTRDELIDKITGGEVFITDRNIDVHIRSIRKKFGRYSGLIVTIRGLGYKWKD